MAYKCQHGPLAGLGRLGYGWVVESSKKKRAPLEKRAGEYLTIAELAEYLPVCEKTIRRDIDAKKLPCLRIRGKLIVAVSDVLAWLSARKEG